MNIKSLAAEAVILRKEASKTSGLPKWGLNHHRTTTVRREARAALLLYAFARGRLRSSLEGHRKVDPYWEKRLTHRVMEKAKRFNLSPDKLKEWMNS